MEFGIHFGSLSDTFEEQIKKQNLKFDKEVVERFQNYYNCILKLRFADLLADSIYHKLLAKLYKQIQEHIIKENKLKIEQSKRIK